jgi:GntR family histidine utilization transcriptional repressor
MSADQGPLALYQRLKNHVQDAIASGALRPGSRVPSESDLVRTFGVSRMTANRALRELASEGLLTRVAGVGTFVASTQTQLEIVNIRNIADEIRERGNLHTSKLVRVGEVKASVIVARSFGCDFGDVVFHTVIVHSENGVPVQIEDRYVNPSVAPDYLMTDFAAMTPHEYLMRVAPLSEVRHVIEAVMPDANARRLLQIGAKEPCLRLFRETWSRGRVGTCAWLTHPGSRYRMVAAFTPRHAPPQLQAIESISPPAVVPLHVRPISENKRPGRQVRAVRPAAR